MLDRSDFTDWQEYTTHRLSVWAVWVKSGQYANLDVKLSAMCRHSSSGAGQFESDACEEVQNIVYNLPREPRNLQSLAWWRYVSSYNQEQIALQMGIHPRTVPNWLLDLHGAVNDALHTGQFHPCRYKTPKKKG